MKTILAFLSAGALLAGAGQSARAQTAPAAAPRADGVMMKEGKMMAVTAGQLTPLTTAMTMANGATVRPDGKLMLPDGQWMPLHEGEQLKLNGMLVPAQPPKQRRLSRFSKHVSADMMKRMP